MTDMMPVGIEVTDVYEMAGHDNLLNFASFNCEHADEVRLPFFRDIFKKCDFFLIQEHGLLKSKLSWFQEIGDNVGIHGVSAMEEDQLLRGRPHGGAAILWHGEVKNLVTPVMWESSRGCAVTVELEGEILLLVCVYMPCDDWRHDGNVIEYKEILNEISVLCNSINVTHVCIGGDFNTDLSRNTPQTEELKAYMLENDLYCCASDSVCEVEYTFCSKINDRRTFIDHFIVSHNLKDKLEAFYSIDTKDNPSDHVSLLCSLKCNVEYSKEDTNQQHTEGPAWHLANDIDIEYYKNYVDYNLLNIPLPVNIINCSDLMCNEHNQNITNF